MKFLLTSILICVLSAGICHAQHTLSGNVFDTLNQAPLTSASVVLLRSSDSVMEYFTRSANDGSFNLKVGKHGRYVLMITFPGFVDYIDAVTVEDAATELGRVSMISRTHLLQEFVLTKQLAAIKIKGDTTEYVADSFKVKDNATVEDLLKKLPGIQVDKNGKVTAQGEEVKKILVDGEEFFSDDPAVVTKNLQSAIVDKVQVYDKKSDQAIFTGIDDGVKDKTINLQLKEDKKKGYFGKADAGGGTDGYFQNQAMINNFKGKKQLSVFGIASNTDQVGLGWADNDKYSSSNMVTQITDGGDMITYYSNENNDFQGWDGKYSGQGLPRVLTDGVHYADKWAQDQQHVTGNYRYAMQDVELNSNTTTQNILPGNVQDVTKQNATQFSRGERHNADAMYEWKIDSSATIKLTVNAGVKHTSTFSAYNTSISYNDAADNIDSIINTTKRTVSSTGTARDINSDLLYQKKFKKKGRTLSLDVKENYKNSQTDGYINSTSLFAAGSDSVIDQHKQNTANTLAFAGKVVYTEPLSKVTFLQLDYGISVNNSNIDNRSYNKPTGGDAYSSFDPLYSSNYKFNVLTNTGGASLRFVYNKINFSFGTDVASAHYKQADLLNHDTTYNYNYLNLFPKAAFTYKLSKMSSLSVNYSGYTNQPAINQVAPLRQNTDPLNIEIGNPAIKQEFHNTVNINYRNYKVVSGSYLYIGAYTVFVNNAISTAQNTDATTGIRTYQYVNVDGNYSVNMYYGYNFKLPKLNITMGPDGNLALNHNTGIINGVQNVSNDDEYTLAYSVDYEKEKKFAFHEHPSYTYNYNRSSVAAGQYSYGQFYNNFTGTCYLPSHFEVGTSTDWWLRQRTAAFTSSLSIFKWNAYVSKKFLKNDKLELKATIFDILDQNTGLTRSAQNNIITQQQYNTIRRHGMLTLLWNFSKAPPAAATDNK